MSKSRADPTRGGSAKNGGGRKTKKWKCHITFKLKENQLHEHINLYRQKLLVIFASAA